jgi:hypothetical protein
MAILELGQDSIRSIPETTFLEAGIAERGDLQRLLRDRIEIISEDTMVIAEEFGNWEDSRRRIDLLGLDKDANLVVIELKRTEDGGHMELQAVRYAAMVSAMTFDDVVAAHGDYLTKRKQEGDPRGAVLGFLGWEEPDEDLFAQDVRIVLASAEFSKELTTAVIWLNERNLDVRCIRMKPYRDGERLLLDVQQLVPLPEAAEFQVQIKKKKDKERQARKKSYQDQVFDVTIGNETLKALPRTEAFYRIVQHLCGAGVSPEKIAEQVMWRSVCLSVNGTLDGDSFTARCKEEHGRKFDAQRFFCATDQLVHFGNKTYAFASNWGPRLPTAIANITEAFADKEVSCGKPRQLKAGIP